MQYKFHYNDYMFSSSFIYEFVPWIYYIEFRNIYKCRPLLRLSKCRLEHFKVSVHKTLKTAEHNFSFESEIFDAPSCFDVELNVYSQSIK